MIEAYWAVDTPITLQAFFENSMNDSNRSFRIINTFLLWSFFNSFVSCGGFSPIRFFVNKALEMALLDQFLHLLLQLLAVFYVVTIVTVEKAVAIAASLTGKFRIKTSWFSNLISLPANIFQD